MSDNYLLRFVDVSRRTLLIAIAVVFALMGLSSIFTNKAEAASLTSRKVTISDSKISATGVNYTFNFSTVTASALRGVRLQFCTQPLGTCVGPTGLSVATANVTAATQTWTNAGDFTDNGSLDEGACTEATNTAYEFCLERAIATSETAGAKQFTIDTVTNPNTQTTVYVRIGTYSDTAFATAIDDGVVATATARQLTVNGRVQERLQFCVAAIDDVAALPADCTAMASTTTIDIGVITPSAVQIAPQNPTSLDGANDFYGVAQVNTNASGGVVVSYYPESALTGTNELRSFRVTGATCNVSGTNLTDQCFVDASGTGEAFVAGTERFGMTLACVDNTQGTTSNLTTGVNAYDGDDNSLTSAADCENEGETEFAWNDTSSAVTLVSSSTVVDDEIAKIRFAATASATTPTGAYTVVSTYIATPTF